MNTRYIFTLSLVLILAAAVTAGNFLILPKYQEVSTVQAEIETVNEQIQQQKEKFAQLKKLKRQLEDYSEEMKIIDNVFPEEPVMPFLYLYIQGLCSENGVVLDNISAEFLAASISGADLKGINFNLQFTGTYDTTKKFLNKLENSARLFITEDFSLKSASPDAGAGEVFNVSITTKTFSY